MKKLITIVLNRQYQGAWKKIKWKIHACFTLYLKFWRHFFMKSSMMIQLPVLLFLVVLHHRQIWIFAIFINFIHHYQKKTTFVTNYSFFMDSPKLFHLLNSQNLLSATKDFLLMLPNLGLLNTGTKTTLLL